MSAMCAAKGCHFMPSSGSLFCYLHPTPIQRKYKLAVYESAPKPVVKAVVTWCPGDFAHYRAEHPDYWTGVGNSPGAALRDMGPHDETPF